MDFRILGAVEVWDEGVQLNVRRPKELGLLSALLLRPNNVVSLDRLTDELWPDDPPAKPAEAVQELVYQLRKVIEAGRPRGTLLERQGDGYKIAVGRDELDRDRFERLVRAAREAKQRGDLDSASWTLGEALSIWRGLPLANVPLDPASVTRAEVERLKEMRLSVLTERLEIDLDRGFETDAISELEPLVAEHRLDERLRALLMVALYRAGRQADALSVYQEIRSTLVDELGIEPGRSLQTLQQQILQQDPELDRFDGAAASEPSSPARATASRAVVVCGTGASQLDSLLALGEPLGRSQLARDLVAVLLLPPGGASLEEGGAFVQDRRTELLARGTDVRATAYSTPSPGEDMSRLASREDVDLLLLALPPLDEGDRLPAEVGSVLETVPCDVGLLSATHLSNTGLVVVPFGGSENDWAALEIGAWAAMALGTTLRLLGTEGVDGQRDASRLLGEGSLVVQQFLRVPTQTTLIQANAHAFVAESQDAALLVVGLPDRWRQDGIGPLRASLVEESRAPVLFVRKGTRPGGLAPREAATMFAWSLYDASGASQSGAT